MAIKTRETTATGVTNKGSPLTNAEVDNNFVELKQDKLENVVEDTTPQLGGNLDFNGNTATSFASTGIDDNATSTAITIDSSQDVTFTSDAKFPDSGKAIFGAGSDLQIYHDGSASFIADVGTGNLNIRGSNHIHLESSDGSQKYISANGPTGWVKLHYAGSEKFVTTSTGIDVTGDVNSDSVTTGTFTSTGIDDNATSTAITISGAETTTFSGDVILSEASPRLDFTDTDVADSLFNFAMAGATMYIRARGGTSDYGDIRFQRNNDGSTNLHTFRINSAGDAMFYDDDGSTVGMRWDASVSRVGIGVGSPAKTIDISSTAPSIRFRDTTATETIHDLQTTGSNGHLFNLVMDVGNAGTSPSFLIKNYTTEIFRFTGTGRLGIGEAAPDEELHIKASVPTIKLEDGDGTNQFVRIFENNGQASVIARNNTSFGNTIFRREDGTNTYSILNLTADGDVDFYDNVGSSIGMRWDASSERLGINDTSPASLLQVGNDTNENSDAYITFGKRVASTETNLPFIGQDDPDGGGHNDLGIGVRSNNGTINFYTGNTTAFNSSNRRMTIGSGGSVTIDPAGSSQGTHELSVREQDSPRITIDDIGGSDTDVNAALLLRADTTNKGVIGFTGTDELYVENKTASGTVRLGTADEDRLIIDSTGKSKFYGQITQITAGTGINASVHTGMGIKGSTPRLTMEPTADSQSSRIQFCDTAGNLWGSIFAYNDTERIQITADHVNFNVDEVAIGTDTPVPAIALTIGDIADTSTTQNSITLQSTISGTNQFRKGLTFRAKEGITTQDVADISFTTGASDASDGNIVFRTSSIGSSVNTERVRIDANGNLGVGESVPQRRLHVNSGSTQVTSIFESTGTSSYVDFANSTTAQGRSRIGAEGTDTLVFKTVGNEAMRIDSDRFVGIGTNDPHDRLEVARLGSAETITNLNGNCAVIVTKGGGTSTSGATIAMIGGDTSDQIGLEFGGLSDPRQSRILHDNSTDDLLFYTNQNERLRILDTGGITFNGDTSTNNALDDYEEGTYTARVFDASSGGNESSTTKVGYYTKVGRVVTVNIWALNNINTSGLTSSAVVYVTLPFAAGSTGRHVGTVNTHGFTYTGSGSGYTNIIPKITQSGSRMNFASNGNGLADGTVKVSDISSGADDIVDLSITYHV